MRLSVCSLIVVVLFVAPLQTQTSNPTITVCKNGCNYARFRKQ